MRRMKGHGEPHESYPLTNRLEPNFQGLPTTAHHAIEPHAPPGQAFSLHFNIE